MIALDNVSKNYVTKGGEVHALKNVSFELPERGLVFLVGKSGSGKTTLLNLLGGLDMPTAGTIKREAGCGDCGFIFQDIGLFPFLTVKENLTLAAGYSAEGQPIEEVLKSVGMEAYAARKTRFLSGGEQQRVAVARALVKNPSVLLADEPTGALDEENAASVFEALVRVAEQRLVVVVTHDSASAEKYADVLYEISDGVVREAFRKERGIPVLSERETVRRKGKNGREECKFFLRLMAASKLRSGLFMLLFMLLVTVLLFAATLVRTTKSEVIWKYVRENEIDYLTFGKTNGLIRLEDCAETGSADYFCSDISGRDFTDDFCLVRNAEHLFALHEGDFSGIVSVLEFNSETGEYEGAQIGDTVEQMKLTFRVSGTMKRDALPAYLQERNILPRYIIDENAYPSDLLSSITCNKVTVLASTLTKRTLSSLTEGGFGLISAGNTELFDDVSPDVISDACDELGAIRVSVTVVGVLLCVTTLLVLAWFVGGFVSDNRRTIGVLKSIGASNSDIARIFGLLFLLFFVISLALGFALNAALIAIANAYFSHEMNVSPFRLLFMNWLYAPALLLLTLAYAVAVLLPLLRIRKISVSELMRAF